MRLYKALLIIPFLTALALQGQDCTLGLGGTDPNTIAGAFELDEGQQKRMQIWVDALEAENAPLQKQLDSLLQSHPQSNPEQLTALGQKYDAIREQMVNNSLRYDRLLLGIFRPAQYRKYEAMCDDAGLFPLEPTSEAFLKEEEN